MPSSLHNSSTIPVFTLFMLLALSSRIRAKRPRQWLHENTDDDLPPLIHTTINLHTNKSVVLARLCNATDGMFSKTKRQCDLWEFVWGSSSLLAAIMCQVDLSTIRVIEVGAGLGLTSLAMAKFTGPPTRLVATDLVVDALRVIQISAKLNHVKLETCKLDFNATQPPLGLHKQFDLVVGSDVLFMSWCAKPMARMCHELISDDDGGGGVIVIADPFRLNDVDFVQELQEVGGFDCTRVLLFPESLIQSHVSDLAMGREKSIVKVARAKLLVAWRSRHGKNNALAQQVIAQAEALGLTA